MKFTDKLYIETKDSHSIVDKNKFVSLIKKDKSAAVYYINLNKICIYEIQKTLKIKDIPLQRKLFRKINQPDIFIDDSLYELLSLCKINNLEAEYMFKGGLIKGGNLLKKYVDVKDHTFLTFENPKELFIELKNYLDQNVVDHTLFIKNVNNIYKLINKCFDFYYDKINNK